MTYPHNVRTHVLLEDGTFLVLEEMFNAITEEVERAVNKHGSARTPLNIRMTREKKLTILVEEMGEVAHDITYDAEDIENLKKELVQVAAMAICWRLSEDWQ